MAKFTSEMVDEYADKLYIGLTREENQMVLEEMDMIDKNIDENINHIKGLENIEPMSWCLDDFICELREDVVEKSVPIEESLQNCDDFVGNEVRVPKVVKKDGE